MNKDKVESLLYELLDNWLQADQDIIDEVCWGEEAIKATKSNQQLRKEYEQKIKELLNE